MIAQLAKLAIQVAGGIVALGRLLLQQPFDYPSQRGGHGGRQGFRFLGTEAPDND